MPVADTGPAGFGVHYATPRSHRWQPRSAAVSAARAGTRRSRPTGPPWAHRRPVTPAVTCTV